MVDELPTPAPVERLSQIAEGYDLFLIDQWGVLHNGEMPHESAVAALRMLHAAGKTIVVISNSSKRRIVSLEGMVRSEEHTSELQSLMRISYAVFCLKKKKQRPRRI